MMKVGAVLNYMDPVTGTEWTNEHTFHIADWMLNEVGIYQNMKKFMQGFDGPIPYRSWIKEMGWLDQTTASGWKLMDAGVHYGEFSEIMRANLD